MIILWGSVWGALLGSLLAQDSGSGFFVGAVLGFLAGLSLRWAVRTEMAASPAQAQARPSSAQPARSAPAVQPPAPQTAQPASASVASAAAPLSVPGSAGIAAATLSAQARPAPKAPPPRPRVPSEPNALDRCLMAVQSWLLGGNTIVRVGLIILFIGLAFLARYAASSGLFPVEFRLAAIAGVAVALLTFGFRKRTEKPGFALALQGAGVAVMYLTVFAAFRLYQLLPPLWAFALMVVVCALSCALALLQNTRTLAVAAFAGGFAVPLLLSTGQGSHVGLFSYYLLLNLAIMGIAYQRSWRILNAIGFIATFGVATAWGVLKYLPEQYVSAQLFLLSFVLIYFFTAIFYARNTPTQLGNAVDSMLVFGTPLMGFGLQVGLVRHLELGSAFSALAFAALYLLAALVLLRRTRDSYRLLLECFIAIGVGFATLAVPLALDAQWTSAVWALEGAAAFWVGKRQARWMPRAFGLLLQAIAAIAFLGSVGNNVSPLPLINPAFTGALLIALPALLLAWWLRQPLAHSGSFWARGYAGFESKLSKAIYCYGFFFCCLAWLLEIDRRVPAAAVGLAPEYVLENSTKQLLLMLAIVGSAALSMGLGLKARWSVATWPARITVVVMALTWLAQLEDQHRVLDTPAWAIWAGVLLLHYAMLRQTDRLAEIAAQAAGATTKPVPFGWLHAASVWLVTALLADGLWSGISAANLWGTSWAAVVWLVSAVAVLVFLSSWAGRAKQRADLQAFAWPLNPHAPVYYAYASMPLAVLVFFGTLLMALNASGHTAPLPYIALLNPTDLTLALGLAALVLWRRVLLSAVPRHENTHWITGRKALLALALLGFVALNSVWLRVAHHYFGVAWHASALFDSFVVQTGYAILWTALALSLMVLAHRRLQRPLWLSGAGLLGLVVVKLLLIDLSNAGGVERIIAFIAVGLLMLVVGYFVPLPPKLPQSPSPVLQSEESAP